MPYVDLCGLVNVPHLSLNVKKLMNVSLFKQVHLHSSNGGSHILSYRYTSYGKLICDMSP